LFSDKIFLEPETSRQDVTDFNNKMKKIIITLHLIKHHFSKVRET